MFHCFYKVLTYHLPQVVNLLEITSDPAKFRKPQKEPAITVDAMEAFVKTTYTLELDGATACCYNL